jgi:chromosome segregation ATPase
MNYQERLLELRNSLSDAADHSHTVLPQALQYAQQKQLIAIEQAQQEITQLIRALQRLQQAVGNHPRYHYDNELYLMNNIQQLRQENELLRIKIDKLLATVAKLEREKQSLYEHISDLECSIGQLNYQLNMYRPIVKPVIIAQYR